MNFEYNIKLNKDNEWSMTKHHFHDKYELLLSLSDAGSLFAGGKLYPLQKGSLIMLKDTTLHKTIAKNCNLYERYVLHFSKDVLREISTQRTDFVTAIGSGTQCVKLAENEMESLVDLLEKCRRIVCCNFGCDLKRDIAFLELMLEVSNFIGSKDHVDYGDNLGFNRISPILEYINGNVAKDMNLDFLAEKFYMSKYHMSRTFKSVTGFTIMDYIINSRILLSRELLRKGYNVQQAGELSGFNNNAHFIRTFGKFTGISPGKYMKGYREGERK